MSFPYLDYSQRVQAAEALIERLAEAVHFMPSCEQKQILLRAMGAYWHSTGRHAWADHYFQHAEAVHVPGAPKNEPPLKTLDESQSEG